MPISPRTPTVALQQVTSNFARNNAERTLTKPVALNYITKFLDADAASALGAACPDGTAFIWGSKSERVHQYGKMVPSHCLVLFRRESVVYKCGVVAKWIWNPELGEFLWGHDADNETWGLVFFLKRLTDLKIPTQEINKLIDRDPDDHWQGLHIVEPPAADRIVAYVKMQLAKVKEEKLG